MVSVTAHPEAEGWTCEVDVEHAGQHTHHTVKVTRRDLDRWGRGNVDDLVRRSFDFLLEREPPSSILKRFELGVIERYFPEYDEMMRRRP